jgi:hypothetical protein
MFRSGFLLIIGTVMLYVDWLLQEPTDVRHDYTNDEQQACSKHVEAYYLNKSIINSASCWFILYEYFFLSKTVCQYFILNVNIESNLKISRPTPTNHFIVAQ